MEDDANKPHALFRSRLLHLLDKRGLSQAALARESGIVQQTLHAWTKAKGAPGPDDLCSLARALRVSVDYLVGFADSAEEAPYGGRDMGRTPCTVRMVHGRSIASLHLDGYHSQEFDVGTEANDALVIGGFVLWGPFELLFDALSGAFVGLDDTPVSVNLAKSTEPMPLTWRRPIEFEPEEEDPGSYGTPPSYGRRP